MQPLVSILTPTYNCGKYIHRLLDSILRQTYLSIEMFVIDDGSTDNTKNIIEKYSTLFSAKGYNLNYIHQENQGQSVAINNGLKLISGEYVIWPDADDFFKTEDAIECLVNALECNDKSYAMARCLIEYLNEDDLKVITQIEISDDFSERLFEDCLYVNKGFWFGSGCYIARYSALCEQIKGLDIYTNKDAGQNWQLMLPILHKYKCVTIPEVKYSVVSRHDSHSRGHYADRKAVNTKLRIYCATIISTLDRIPSMDEQERAFYKNNVTNKYRDLKLQNNFYCWVKRPIKQILSTFKR